MKRLCAAHAYIDAHVMVITAAVMPDSAGNPSLHADRWVCCAVLVCSWSGSRPQSCAHPSPLHVLLWWAVASVPGSQPPLVMPLPWCCQADTAIPLLSWQRVELPQTRWSAQPAWNSSALQGKHPHGEPQAATKLQGLMPAAVCQHFTMLPASNSHMASLCMASFCHLWLFNNGIRDLIFQELQSSYYSCMHQAAQGIILGCIMTVLYATNWLRQLRLTYCTVTRHCWNTEMGLRRLMSFVYMCHLNMWRSMRQTSWMSLRMLLLPALITSL